MPGMPVTGTDVNFIAGQLSSRLKRDIQESRSFKAYLDSKTSQELLDIGMTQLEIDTIKSAFSSEMDSIITDFEALVFIDRLWGTGVTL